VLQTPRPRMDHCPQEKFDVTGILKWHSSNSDETARVVTLWIHLLIFFQFNLLKVGCSLSLGSDFFVDNSDNAINLRYVHGSLTGFRTIYCRRCQISKFLWAASNYKWLLIWLWRATWREACGASPQPGRKCFRLVVLRTEGHESSAKRLADTWFLSVALRSLSVKWFDYGWPSFVSGPKQDLSLHQQDWGSPIITHNGYRLLFYCGEIQTEREADHSPQSNSEV
jgi:hypothetical protein